MYPHRTDSRYRQLARDVLRRARNLGRINAYLTAEEYLQAVQAFYPFRHRNSWPLVAWKAEVQLALEDYLDHQQSLLRRLRRNRGVG